MTITEEILQTIFEVGEFLPRFGETKQAHLSRLSHLKRGSFYAITNRLEKKGLVVRKKQGRVHSYSLTPKARLLMEKRAPKIRRSDGLSTVIVFDIPEIHKASRDYLRRYLQNNGFTQLQRSVYISPDKVDKQLLEIINDLKIEKFTTLLLSKVIQDKNLWI